MAVVRQEAIGMPELDIRSMQDADIGQVLRIEQASYAFPWTEGIFRDCLRVNYTCRVAEIGVVTVGYGILSVAAGEAHLLNLCVADAYRCRGIGRRLLAHLLLAAGDAAAKEAFLEARPSNTSAIRLYQSLGFTQIGMRRGYYQAVEGREDAIVLKRRID
jgi:[ribosomal protein S18]-alanine N-acetyltransferase